MPTIPPPEGLHPLSGILLHHVRSPSLLFNLSPRFIWWERPSLVTSYKIAPSVLWIQGKNNSGRRYFRALESDRLELKSTRHCAKAHEGELEFLLSKFMPFGILPRFLKNGSLITSVTQHSDAYDSPKWCYTESRWANLSIPPRNLKFG